MGSGLDFSTMIQAEETDVPDLLDGEHRHSTYNTQIIKTELKTVAYSFCALAILLTLAS